MRRFLAFLSILIVVLLCSCNPDPNGTFKVGDRGPAGGWVFYDCDADNASGNADGLTSEECGWRYLEAAPRDMKIGSTTEFPFGYYRLSDDTTAVHLDGSYDYHEGTSNVNDGKSTGTAIGTGSTNTVKLVNKLGPSAYADNIGASRTDQYAAKLCSDYSVGGYDDWFLPSKDELSIMFANLSGKGNFKKKASYWSSSIYVYPDGAWAQAPTGSTQWGNTSSQGLRVRAIHAF